MKYLIDLALIIIVMLLLAMVIGCASQPQTPEEQAWRMERFRAGIQLLMNSPPAPISCTTSRMGDQSYTTCR